MKTRKWILSLLALTMLAACTAAIYAQSPGTAAPPPRAAAPPAAARPLDQLAWMVGGTWASEEKDDNGGILLIKLTCTWAETRQAIVFKVTFESGEKKTPQYDGMFVWNPEKQKLTLWQVNRKGEVAEGTLAVNGDEMDQLARVVHPDGSLHFLKVHYRRTDADTFRLNALFRLSETAEWQPALDLVYKRGS